MKRYLVAVLVLGMSFACAQSPALAEDFADRGWVKVQDDPEIWKDESADPQKLYNEWGWLVKDLEGETAGVQPMVFTDENGEVVDFAVDGDGGPNAKLRIVEDNDQCKVMENTMTYNDGAMEDTGANAAEAPPTVSVQWLIRDAETGSVVADVRGMGTSNLLAPTFEDPGIYYLGNNGNTRTVAGGTYGKDKEGPDGRDMTVAGGTYGKEEEGPEGAGTAAGGTYGTEEEGPEGPAEVAGVEGASPDPDLGSVLDPEGEPLVASKEVASATYRSAQAATLEIVDVTSPTARFALIPEDTRAYNCVETRVDPDLTNKYPIPERQALMYVGGDNFVPPDENMALASGNEFFEQYVIPYGTPREGDEVHLTGNGRDEVEVRTRNEFVLDQAVDSIFGGLEGFFVRAGVPVKFVMGPFEDNGSKPGEISSTWKVVARGAEVGDREIIEPQSHVFMIPNYPPGPGKAEYTFVCGYEDRSGNGTEVRVPIHVLPAGVDIRKMDYRQGRGD